MSGGQQLANLSRKRRREEGVEITSRSLVRFNPVIFADEIVNAVEAEAGVRRSVTDVCQAAPDTMHNLWRRYVPPG